MDLLSDLFANAVESGAKSIAVRIAERNGEIVLEVEDNGPGMTPEARDRSVDPFVTSPGKHPGRAIGMGLAFLRQTAETCDGRWWLESEAGAGTRVGLSLPAGGVDTPPLGDVVQTIVELLAGGGDCQVVVTRQLAAGGYVVDREELRSVLEEGPGDMSTAGSRQLLCEYVASQEDALWER
jgi:hypothetical protein